MNDFKFLNLSTEDGILIVRINKPPANPLDMELIGELSRIFDIFSNSEDGKVMIITGGIDNIFIAGADIKMLGDMSENIAEKVTDKFQACFNKLMEMPKIIIAAINGHALGGGCELALACDFRFMADREKVYIGLPEVTLGILPGAGGTQRLPRLIGISKALELIIFGKRLTPREALQIGIVDKVFPPEDLIKKSIDFARDLTRGATKSIGLIKRAINQGLQRDIYTGLKIEKEAFIEVFKTDDAKEGLRAFIEKRKPEFKGR